MFKNYVFSRRKVVEILSYFKTDNTEKMNFCHFKAYLGTPLNGRVSLQASGVTDSHGVTGGVYKARERIHRDMLIRDY